MQNHVFIFLLFLYDLFSEPSVTNWRLNAAQKPNRKFTHTLKDNNLSDIIPYGDTGREREGNYQTVYDSRIDWGIETFIINNHGILFGHLGVGFV